MVDRVALGQTRCGQDVDGAAVHERAGIDQEAIQCQCMIGRHPEIVLWQIFSKSTGPNADHLQAVWQEPGRYGLPPDLLHWHSPTFGGQDLDPDGKILDCHLTPMRVAIRVPTASANSRWEVTFGFGLAQAR